MSWADVATKQDLELLETRLRLHIAEEFRKQTTRMWTAMIVSTSAAVGIAEGLGRLG